MLERLKPLMPAVLATALLVAAGGPPAGAQESYSEEDLQAFARASLQIEEIQQEWQPRVADASSKSEADELRQQAMDQMVRAVRDEGLGVETYNGIYQVVQADPEVAEKVKDYRDDLQ